MQIVKYCTIALILCLVSLCFSASTVDEYDLEVLEENAVDSIDPFSLSSTLITSTTANKNEKELVFEEPDEPEVKSFDFPEQGKLFLFYF